MDLTPLFTAIRGACSSRSWSRGIELNRADAVDGVEAGDEEITLRVKVPGKTVAPMVSLWPEDDEWDCDCASTADCCEHVAAAILALRQARKAGQDLPRSAKAGGRIGYRLAPDGDKLELRRVVVSGSGEETPLSGTVAGVLSGREKGPALEPDKADLSLDRLIAMHRVRSHHADVMRDVLPLLAEVEDVQLEGEAVKVDPRPLGPRGTVTNAAGGYRLRLDPPDGVLQAVGGGVVLVEGEEGPRLRPLALVELVGPRLERLPVESVYERMRTAELVGEVLPKLRAHGEVQVQAKGLPTEMGRVAPAVLLQVEQRGGALSVVPLLVYGDPPVARVDGGELKLLARGKTVPKRDRRGEERVLAKLREELDLVPGRRAEVMGREAIQLAAKLRGWKGPIDGDAHRTRYPKASLEAELDLNPAEFSARFKKGGHEADASDVMRAWERGENVVPLLGGGWAELPASWLSTHGDRVAALLAAKRADGTVAPYARPAMAQLCDALERPRPPQLAALGPLVDGFTALPEAALPGDLDAELRPYQTEGVAWLQFMRRAELGAVLADDMGLGKTLQALCALPTKGRVLVVCPRSVVHNWANEIARFRSSLTVALYHGSNRRLDEAVDVTLTTYALLRNDIEALEAVPWSAVILDEAQTIKNPDSQVTRAAYRLRAGFRLTLSGTPVENRLDELWSQLHFVNPGMLGGRQDFAERYEKPLLAGEPGAGSRLRERIKPFVLRRTKDEVLTDLPPRTDAVLSCELTSAERDVYDAIQLGTREQVAKRLGEGGNVLEALEALLRLRQAACDAALVPGQSALATEDGKPRASSKVRGLMLALEDAQAGGHKSLVFSQWTSLLDRVEPHLDEASIGYCRLDGSTRDRAAVVDRFQDPSGPPVMLVSLKAGGTGLNLTAADHVFMLDPWWNPAVEDQAADRAHRIGQERPVTVYRMVAKDTVEERILKLQEQKRAVADAALGEADRAVSLTRDDLLALLG